MQNKEQKSKRQSFLSRTRNSEAAMSLINVLLSLFVIAVLISTGFQLTDNVTNTARKLYVPFRLIEIRNNIVQHIQNDASWYQILNYDTSGGFTLACLRDETDCTGLGSSTNFAIVEPDGTVYYDPTTATNGFDIDGNTCSTYSSSPAAGSRCLYRVDLSWTPLCISGSSCNQPRVSITGTLSYSAPSGETTPIKLSRYDFTVIREPDVGYHKMVLSETQTSGTNGGACTAGTWNTISWDTPETVDTGDDITLGGCAASKCSDITLRTGVYECEISAPAYQVGAHRLRLQTSTGNVIQLGPSTNAKIINPHWSLPATYYVADIQNRAKLTARFSLNEATTLNVQHYCETNTAATDFGRPMSIGTETYSLLKCVKL